MKINLPVTQHEVMLLAGQNIVSKTDLKGQITYVNETFLEISGFPEAELIGQSHNIVRHPDMPPEAFADFWAMIKDERPWTGLVKNRCKNGDFYWVRANAAPLTDGQGITGYLSVRTRPDPAEVQAAEALYARMRADAAAGPVGHSRRAGGQSRL